MTPGSPLLELKNISKSFGDNRVNDSISLSLQQGQIHALVGENGAGKSTLMKILFGLYQADQGEIFLHGKKIEISSPIRAKQLGIGMVHQHFMLASHLPALDHLILDQTQDSNKPKSFWRQFLETWIQPIPRRALLDRANALSEKFQMPVDWNEPVENLSVGIQQRIEILKLLFNQAHILIFDEPTAVLTPQEIDQFFMQLKLLKASGHSILLITHKLKEVLQLADQVSVLRQGRLVFSGPVPGLRIADLATHMVGRDFEFHRPVYPSTPAGKDLLRLNAVTLRPEGINSRSEKAPKNLLKEVSLTVRCGEIVGIAGVEGNGQSDLLKLLMLPQKYQQRTTGTMTLLKYADPDTHTAADTASEQKNVLAMTNLELRNSGVCYLPEDRLQQGALGLATAYENFLLGQQFHSEFQKNQVLMTDELQRQADVAMKKYDVRPANGNQIFSTFSGGNQQKLVVARELSQNPRLIIAAQPTRGVDIGAIEQIHQQLIHQRNSGKGILLVSSELDELIKLSDRLLVMFQGKIVGEFSRDQFDEKQIGLLMGGGPKPQVNA